MTTSQRMIFSLALAIMAVMALCPPWILTTPPTQVSANGATAVIAPLRYPLGFAWVWAPPQRRRVFLVPPVVFVPPELTIIEHLRQGGKDDVDYLSEDERDIYAAEVDFSRLILSWAVIAFLAAAIAIAINAPRSSELAN